MGAGVHLESTGARIRGRATRHHSSPGHLGHDGPPHARTLAPLTLGYRRSATVTRPGIPARAFAGRSPHTLSAGRPTPPAPAAKDTHILLPATPTPPAPSQEDTHTLLLAAPPRPRLRQRIPIPFYRPPHPARASGAPPSPHPGRGPCPGVYQVSSRIRGVAGGPPCPALLQDLPMCWTVGISPLGVGLTGRGNEFPLPCLPCSKYLTSPASPTPPAPSQGDTHALLPAPPPRPRLCRQRHSYASAGSPHPARACGAPPPPPAGAGSVPGRISGEQPYPGFLRDLPMCWTVVDIATGGEADGEGELVPPPLSPTLQPSYFSPASPTPPAPLPAEALIRPSPASPPHPRLRRSSPAPPRAGSVPGRISGEQPYPGWSQWAAVFWVSPRSRRALDHGGYVRPPIGEAARREEVCPLPLSPTLPEPHPLSSGAGACVTIFNRRQCPVPPGFSPYSGPWWTPRVAGPRQALSGRTAFHHLHHDCAGGCPSGSEIAWRK